MPKQVPWTRIWSAIGDLASLEDFSEDMELPAELAMEALMHHIEARQPYGHEEQGYPQGSVSERLNQTPISKGWVQDLEPLEKGLRLNLVNASEHFRWYIRRTRRHPIPGNPRVRFWWGSPHPWPAPAYHRDTGKEMGPGMYVFDSVDHPGTQENPFVRQARDEARPEMVAAIRGGIGLYIDRVLTSAGLRRKR